MRTYNFLITVGNVQFQTEINAYSEDEAIDIIQKEYRIEEGYRYMLI